ncbi:MAG: T9SS type A sorting domain-containing protein [Candidatus Paceibacterota bacterium]
MGDVFNDLDIGGNYIYCTGIAYQVAISTDRDYVTAKYNFSGMIQTGWPKFYDGPGGSSASFDQARDVMVSTSSGKIYVTGETQHNTNKMDVTTIRYSTTGTQEWVVTYNNSGVNWNDQALTRNSLALSLDGCHAAKDYVYVTGRSQVAASGDIDMLTLKYTDVTTPCDEAPGGEGRYVQQENNVKSGLYPNPFSSSATLAVGQELTNAVLNIYDLYGKLIFSQTGISSSAITIEKGSITEGVYFYQLVDNDNLVTFGKMIIQ